MAGYRQSLENKFPKFQVVDEALREFTVVHDLGFTGGMDEVRKHIAGLTTVLSQIVAQAEKGFFSTLRRDKLDDSELDPIRNYGEMILKMGTPQKMSETLFYTLNAKQKRFAALNNYLGIQIVHPKEQYNSYQIILLAMAYLSSVNRITYEELTARGDTRVHFRIGEKPTFWAKNLTQQNIMHILSEMQKVLQYIKRNPQIIMTDRQALELCHFVALVSKLGRLQ